ncbi:MAG: lysophospholipid acyltransferase family protein [Candidatus Omnitrophica bacterium]|nr:lysophospholipid acyltransferase family protein [Candidatus Omnitrophota bacterium]
MKYKLRRDLVYLLLRGYSLVILILPFRIAVYCGGLLGTLAYYLIKHTRRQVKENLSLAFNKDINDPWIKQTAKAVFENLGKSLNEVLSFPKINKKNIDSLVEASDLEKVDQVLKQGKGVIMLAPHLDNWELLACCFSLKGYKLNVIAKRLYFHRYDKFLNYYRTLQGTKVLDRDGSIKKILKVLKDNQVLGILPDQDVDSLKGIFVDFFGRPAYTPVGPVSLALAGGAPIVPCFIIRTGKGHKLIVEEPIEVRSSGNKDKDIEDYTKVWTGIIESYIRKYPGQWVWMHQRWKTQLKS